MDRKSLTFEEAEGAHPLPSQLDRTQVSAQVRATLWAVFTKHVVRNRVSPDMPALPWYSILRDEYAFHQYLPIDEFWGDYRKIMSHFKSIIFSKNYIEIFGLIQWIVRHSSVPKQFVDDISAALVGSRSAYRLIDGDTLVPVSDPLAAKAIETALADAKADGLAGAQEHLRRALDYFGADRYADSVRESIHAVEAVARTFDPGSKTLGEALTKLEKAGAIHPAMKSGFSALYGYTNDEHGIRHALLDRDIAKVDEAEALFMLGACAAFVSYLVAKGRTAAAQA